MFTLTIALSFDVVDTSAINTIRLPPVAKKEIVNINTKFDIEFIEISTDQYFGSGTLIPEKYLSETRILSQSGVLTTAHIFQDAYIKDYLEESKAINLSGNNTMKRNYNIGQSIEYAIFIPISLINNLQQRSLISTKTISKMNVNGAFETINLDKNLPTQMIGATSNDINLQESLMQERDSGSLVFQRQNEKLNISGIQFGYAKNSNTPMTIMWRLKKI